MRKLVTTFARVSVLLGLTTTMQCSLLSALHLRENPAADTKSIAPEYLVPEGDPHAWKLLADKSPLPPEPNEDSLSAIHKQYFGKVVFTTDKDSLPKDKENPEKWKTEFSLSDTVYMKIFMNRSPGNAMRAIGMSCKSEPSFLLYAEVDGGAPIQFNTRHELDSQKQTMVRFAFINAPSEDGDKEVGEDFVKEVLPKLTVGTHTVRMKVAATCGGLTSPGLSWPNARSALAYGDITLKVGAADSKGMAVKSGRHLPAAAMTDPALEAKFKNAAAAQWERDGTDDTLKVVITDSEWSPIRNKLTGILTGRSIRAIVATKNRADKKCRTFRVTFIEECTDNSGTVFGSPYFGGSRYEEEIPCENVE